MEKPKQVFIGSALTHVPLKFFDEHKNLIVSIADLVENMFGCKAKYAMEDSDPMLPSYVRERRPAECYRMDRELVEQCDLFIAEASFPSTGLGQELQVAEYNNKPVILIYRNYGTNLAEKKDYQTKIGENHSIELGEKIVSVMVQGNPAVRKEIFYNDVPHCVNSLKLFLEKFYK